MEIVPLAAMAAGLVVGVAFALRRRAGRDPFGPRPEGDLPDTWLALVLGVLAYFAAQSGLQYALGGASDAVGDGLFRKLFLPAAVNVAVALALLPAASRGTRKPSLSRSRLLAAGALSGLVVFAAETTYGFAAAAVYGVLDVQMPKQAIVEEVRAAAGLDLVTASVAALVFAPVAEEIFFRGVMLPAFARVTSPARALLLQALCFGAIHFVHDLSAWPLAIALAIVGWSAGWLYLRTGSLVAPIAMHSAFNVINLVAMRTAHAPTG